jgi:transposase InsO family protein
MATAKRKSSTSSKCPSRGHRYSPAERGVILDLAKTKGVSVAAREHRCSAWTIYRWLSQETRKNARAKAAPAARSTPPASAAAAASALSPEQEERHQLILQIWHEQPGLGPTQIRNQLHRRGFKASVHTVRQVMEDHGYVQPRVKRKEHTGAYEALRPRQLYHLDFLHFYVHKQRQCLLLIEDDFSRFIAGWTLLAGEQADGVVETFELAVARYGKPEGVMSDRGAAFFAFRGVSRFERILAEYNIDHLVATEPSTNGKVEALNATVRKELLTRIEFADLADARIQIGAWVHQYNYRRTNMALGGLLVPADRFHGLVEEAMQRIEQGNGGDPLDLFVPTGRGLDLFRVSTVGGQPVVWLMGKKILG